MNTFYVVGITFTIVGGSLFCAFLIHFFKSNSSRGFEDISRLDVKYYKDTKREDISEQESLPIFSNRK